MTDFWVLDNNVIVRILRHREPYEILLADYQSVEPLPGLLERSEEAARAGKLSGVALDAATGKPVERSRVRVASLILSGGVKAALDTLGLQRAGLPDGRFELDGLMPGTATLEVSAPGYTPKVVPDVSVESGETTSGIEVRLSPARDTFDELTAALAPGAEGIVVEAMVDGDSELHVTSEGVYWKCAGGYSAKPGLHEGYEEPTYLNGEVWWPRWGIPANRRCHDQTELAKFSVPAVERLKFELIAVGQPRGAEGINRRDPVTSRHEGAELVVSIPDRNSGWQWYRFRIYTE
jgi:hypothetical protein